MSNWTGTAAKASEMYLIDGGYYPRVSSILGVIGKPALLNWMAKTERELVISTATELWESYKDRSEPILSGAAFALKLTTAVGTAKAGDRLKGKAADIGTAAHKRSEWLLKKMVGIEEPEPIVSTEALYASQAAEKWITESGFKPLYIEQQVVSKKYGYAGTLDFSGMVSGKLIVGDFKTSKAIYGEALLQLAAYSYAMDEMGHGPIEGAAILRLPKTVKDPSFEIHKIGRPQIDKYFEVFLAALKLWNGMKVVESDLGHA